MKVFLKKVSDELPIDLKVLKHKFRLNDSDEYLKGILKVAFENVESSLDLSLRKKTWKVVHNNNIINLSKGPVREIVGVKNLKGEDVQPLSISRVNDNLMLKFKDDLGWIHVMYESGYEKHNLPECLKISLVNEFWKLYSENEASLELLGGTLDEDFDRKVSYL